MLLIEDLDDSEYLCGLFETMYDELPEPKKRKSKLKFFTQKLNRVKIVE